MYCLSHLDFTNIIPVMDAYVMQLRELAKQKNHMMPNLRAKVVARLK